VLLDVWSVMRESGLQRVPVLDKARRPLGIIYARDALQALLTESENEDELLRDYISGVGYR
jgi:CBS domain-containing protein